ncbi:hypothetical protein Y032_0074g896 [Ancylostoma ceylanicum]|uniref:Uncharacterized protein n=1 Tax=Ancylostoma ceylanicum TaxID=53326 RepID=A0A016TUS9_9BILA|nr:hypothetical protein Y032_0074g896 [Ancylostoma ceylanicum]
MSSGWLIIPLSSGTILRFSTSNFSVIDASENPTDASEITRHSSEIHGDASTQWGTTFGATEVTPSQPQLLLKSNWANTRAASIKKQTSTESLSTVLEAIVEDSYETNYGPEAGSMLHRFDSTTIAIIASAVVVLVLILIIAIVGLVYERGKQKRKKLLKEQLEKDNEKEMSTKRKRVGSTSQARNKKKRRKRHKSDSDSSESATEKKKKRSTQKASSGQQKPGCDPVKKAVADYLEAQLQTCRLAVDPEKAGGDFAAVKPADLKDDGYFGIGPQQ